VLVRGPICFGWCEDLHCRSSAVESCVCACAGPSASSTGAAVDTMRGDRGCLLAAAAQRPFVPRVRAASVAYEL
jgi:hypothetical protein